MKTYKCEITETLQYQEDIKADTKDDALRILAEKYENSEIILDADNLVDVRIDESNELKTTLDAEELIDNLLNLVELDRKDYEAKVWNEAIMTAVNVVYEECVIDLNMELNS